MASHLSNPWNNAVLFLEMLRGQNRLATGSSFLWATGDRVFLISNWHNLAGRHPNTKQSMHELGDPDRVAFTAWKRVSEPDAGGFFELRSVRVEVQLQDDHWDPRWLEHPQFGSQVDIAAIDVTAEVKGLQVACVNILESDADPDAAASQDVFVVGFPFGLMANAPVPIWKRGTIAVDPTYDVEGLPKMLVDTATREGMSGSVVIARQIVVGRNYKKKDGTMSAPVLYATHDVVLGVYSGRHYPDLDRAQLGIVWKRRAIEETISGGQRANV